MFIYILLMLIASVIVGAAFAAVVTPPLVDAILRGLKNE
jgi:large-conductance mechanosensitive channel